MLRRWIVILVAIFAIGAAAPCHCQEEEQQGQQQEQPRKIKVVTGNIADLDWAGSKIVIKGYDAADNTSQDIVIDVPDSAVIRKGAENVGFSELQIDDAATAKYYEDSQGNATLISLEDSTPTP